MNNDELKTTDYLDRTAKDFAIEFGGYLATAAERFIHVLNETLPDCITLDDDLISDHWRSLQSAIYEFRTRACYAKRKTNESSPDILTATREIARAG